MSHRFKNNLNLNLTSHLIRIRFIADYYIIIPCRFICYKEFALVFWWITVTINIVREKKIKQVAPSLPVEKS